MKKYLVISSILAVILSGCGGGGGGDNAGGSSSSVGNSSSSLAESSSSAADSSNAVVSSSSAADSSSAVVSSSSVADSSSAVVSSSSSSSSSSRMPPTVSGVSPANGATEVSRSISLTASFDSDLLASTVSETSFTLASNGSIDGTVSFDVLTNTATFTPDKSLALLSSYTATLTTDITNVSGEPMSTVFNWNFTTADGSLSSTVEQVQSDNSAGLDSPKIIYSNDGNAIAIWYARPADTGDKRLWANKYTAGSGWGSAFILQADTSTSVTVYQLAANDNGDALACWSQNQSEIWARRYHSATDSWDDAEKIATGSGLGDVSVALRNDGTALVVWSMKSDSIWDVYASHYSEEADWSTPEAIDSGDDEAYLPQVKFDGSGNAIAVWSQKDATQFSVYANRYVAGTGWADATLVESLETGTPYSVSAPQLAVDASGNALVVWDHYDGSHYNLWYNRYDVNSGWQSEAPLENDDLDIRLPALAMNASGNAIVAWAKTDASFNFVGYSSRVFTPGTGWGEDQPFTYAGTSFDKLAVAMDVSGNALFAWAFDDDTNSSIWFNRYRSASGWAGASEVPRVGNDYGDYSPQVAMKSDGEAMLIFGSVSTDTNYISTQLFH